MTLNYNPDGLIALSVILTIIAHSCVFARLSWRRKQEAGFALDDWVILLALAVGTGVAVLLIYTAAAIGDSSTLTPSDFTLIAHLDLAFLILGVIGAGLVKLSVSLLLRRIFEVSKTFRIIVSGWIVLIVIWTLGFTLAALLECGTHLTSLFGSKEQYEAHCGSAEPSGFAYVISDVVTDFITLLLPIPMVLRLHMPPLRKLLVVANLLVGLLSVGASIGKAYVYIVSVNDPVINPINTLYNIAVWSLVEIELGTIAACGPSLRPFISNLVTSSSLSHLFSSAKRRGSLESGTILTSKPSNITPTSREAGLHAAPWQHENSTADRGGFQSDASLHSGDYGFADHERTADSRV